MKILFATYEGVFIAGGGPYIKITEVQKHLRSLGAEADILNISGKFSDFQQYDIIHLVGSNFSIYGLARSLNQNNINFLVEPVFYSRHSPAFLKAVSAIDKINRKLFPGLWLDYGIIRDICSWAKAVLPNTSDEKKLISSGLGIPEEKFHIIPNGVSERFLDPDPSLFINKYGIKDFVLNVGHIGPKRKNVLALVKALEKTGYPAVIIGRTMNTGESEEVRKITGRAKNILLLDELPNDSPLLASAYAACSAFVLPSLFETPGIAALEAALAGAKIVITPYGGTKDYFLDMAAYIDPYSVESISSGIESAIRTGSSGKLKEHIKNNYMWESVARKSLLLYKQIVSGY